MSSSYRPEIDGLRAVAVLSVVLFHAGFSMFSGGFVGVDIFFVISGYLITRLLVAESHRHGRVNFANFYLRRARRLLPAMLFVLSFTTVVAIWLLSPLRLESYGASLIHAVLSFPNIYFYAEADYFDSASKLKPLLHTWSLGVEEQFYYVWPVLLAFLALRKLWAPIFVIIVGFISLYFCQVILSTNPDASFYLMPFRVYEFAIGAMLVWVRPPASENVFRKNIVLAIGFGMLIYSIFWFDYLTPFPGLNALLPCVGAALCIYAGDTKYLGVVLNNRVAVGLGLISYSLYLAHWPIIVFYTLVSSGELRMVESALLFAASLLAAVFMYFLIEKPFRKVRQNNGQFLLICGFISIALAYIGASMWANEGWGWRSWVGSGSLSSQAIKQGKNYRFHVRQKICEEKGWSVCDDLIDGKINVLIIGDSHAVDALNAFEKIFPEHNFSLSELGGCPPHRDIEAITQPSHPNRADCKRLNFKRFDKDYLLKFDYVVINVLFGWYSPDHLAEYLDFLKAQGVRKVIVFGDYFVLRQDMSEILINHGYDSNKVSDEIVESNDVDEKIKVAADRHDYYFISKRDVFCASGKCSFFDADKTPFTYDQHHLSYEFASRLAVNEKNALDKYLRGLQNKTHKAPNPSVTSGTVKAEAVLTDTHNPGAKLPIISLNPASLSLCHEMAVVRVRWNVRDLPSGIGLMTQVWIKEADGNTKLFASGADVGEEVTGPWARPGMVFMLKDAGTGVVLAEVELKEQECTKP